MDSCIGFLIMLMASLTWYCSKVLAWVLLELVFILCYPHQGVLLYLGFELPLIALRVILQVYGLVHLLLGGKGWSCLYTVGLASDIFFTACLYKDDFRSLKTEGIFGLSLPLWLLIEWLKGILLSNSLTEWEPIPLLLWILYHCNCWALS